VISGKRPDYQHEVHRVDQDGTEHRMPLADRDYSLGYGLIGEADWESAERVLVDQHTVGEWKPGTYKIAVSRHTVNGYVPWVTVVRQLPLHEAYARLPYKPGPNDKLPARAYIHTLVSRYPGATIELVAEHINDFDQHYRATISTPALALRTGYQLPPDTPRPLSPYADHADDTN
jgi:hypothetical protein